MPENNPQPRYAERQPTQIVDLRALQAKDPDLHRRVAALEKVVVRLFGAENLDAIIKMI